MVKIKVLHKFLKRNTSVSLDHFYGKQSLHPQLEAYLEDIKIEDDDDASSISSVSTTATCDNNVGPGRVLDAYFYQPLGRKVERYAAAVHSTLGLSPQQALIRSIDDDGDNGYASSIDSGSTTATCDNNPGPGRIIDMHFYQPFGRRIEKFAMRLTIASLLPWQISRFLEDRFKLSETISPRRTLTSATEDIHRYWPDGSTYVVGLKGLVRQTQ